jgi:hypothetical protein
MHHCYVLHCAVLVADVAADVRACGDVAYHYEFLKRPSQAPAPTLRFPPASRSNPDAAAMSCPFARRGRHPPRAAAGNRELYNTVVDGVQEVASTTALGCRQHP